MRILVALIFLLIGGTTVCAGEAASEVIVKANERPHGGGWSEGTLTINLQNPLGQTKVISVRFRQERQGKFKSLEIVTSDWIAKLDDITDKLDLPFPNRSIVKMPDWGADGRVDQIIFDVPYIQQVSSDLENTSPRCMMYEVLIAEGRVSRTVAFDAAKDECKQ